MKKITDLPPELLLGVLGHLPLRDLWNSCRSTCRKLKTVSEQVFVTKIKRENAKRYLSTSYPDNFDPCKYMHLRSHYSLNLASFRTSCEFCDGLICGSWFCRFNLDYSGFKDGSELFIQYASIPIYHSSILLCSRSISSGPIQLWMRFFDSSQSDEVSKDMSLRLPADLQTNGVHCVKSNGMLFTFTVRDDDKSGSDANTTGKGEVQMQQEQSRGKRVQLIWAHIRPSFLVSL